MREDGASSEAIRFTEMTDTTGYVRQFACAGNVGIAYVDYPFRANENLGIILVNGDPPMIDVDDFRHVDLEKLKRDSTYLKLVSRYPDASLWPGDRFNTSEPHAVSLKNGHEGFIVTYTIRNGCHACEEIGTVRFEFVFGKEGRFMGTTLLQVIPSVR